MAKIEANYRSLFFFSEIESQKIGNARGTFSFPLQASFVGSDKYLYLN